MRIFPKLVLLLFIALAACKSDEERAEEYYQSGLSLLEAGDVDRALVEFRNVFARNPRHHDARLTYANAQRARGELADAYGQYLRLVEFVPDHAEGLIALSQIAILSEGWEEAERYGPRAAALLPDDDRTQVIQAMLDYRTAMIANAPADAPTAVARAALEKNPQSLIARKIVIDATLETGNLPAALDLVETGLDIAPDRGEFHQLRVAILREQGDTVGAQTALEQMAAQFPENPDIQRELMRWYIGNQDLASAEAYLRDLAAAPDAGEAEKVTVVNFLRQTQGNDAARAELERLIASEEDNARYRGLRAGILFVQDEQDLAISELEDLIDAGGESADIHNYNIILAEFLQSRGEEDKAKERVASVLADDGGNVQALRMQAQWAIAEDDPSRGLILLRQALAEEPRNVQLMLLMAAAHERAGDYGLAGERYALAVEASSQGVEPVLAQTGFLISRGRLDSAQSVIDNALAGNPNNIRLLAMFADVHLRQGDWDQVTRTIWKLRAFDTEAATAAADEVELALLNRQERYEDTQSFLEELIAGGDSSTAAKARLVEAQIRAGKLDEARAFLDAELAANPEDPTLQFLAADILVLSEKPAEGEERYRALLATYPGSEQILGRLYGLLLSQGRDAEATAVIEDVIAQEPGAIMANVIKSSMLETSGDFEGAIAILEPLYAANSNNLIVANNLASLISVHRQDAENLDRAYAIAARMKGTDVPAFQDTLGWIAFRRGDIAEALSYLEPAAAGLPEDPLVQYHLGRAYHAAEDFTAARDALSRALELAGNSPLSQFESARQILANLDNE